MVLPVMLALACFPSLVAVMVAEPAPAAVTRPLPVTVAIDELLLVHATTRPVSTPPIESWGVAFSCTL